MKTPAVQSSRRFYGDTDFPMSIEGWQKRMLEEWEEILEVDAFDPVPSIYCYGDGEASIPIRAMITSH